MKAEPILIKRYANRRLYDTEALRYLTLGELAKMVRGGEMFVVREAETGEDITAPC